MDYNNKKSKKEHFVCLKRSISNSDLETYKTSEYKSLVAQDLNTGVSKFFFDNRADAEKKLLLAGTSWNMCVVDINPDKLKFDTRSKSLQLVASANIQFEANDIKEITLHPTLQPEENTSTFRM